MSAITDNIFGLAVDRVRKGASIEECVQAILDELSPEVRESTLHVDMIIDVVLYRLELEGVRHTSVKTQHRVLRAMAVDKAEAERIIQEKIAKDPRGSRLIYLLYLLFNLCAGYLLLSSKTPDDVYIALLLILLFYSIPNILTSRSWWPIKHV